VEISVSTHRAASIEKCDQSLLVRECADDLLCAAVSEFSKPAFSVLAKRSPQVAQIGIVSQPFVVRDVFEVVVHHEKPSLLRTKTYCRRHVHLLPLANYVWGFYLILYS